MGNDFFFVGVRLKEKKKLTLNVIEIVYIVQVKEPLS